MPSKDKDEQQSGFVVNDRRLFGSDGELREDVVKAEQAAAEQERVAQEAQQRVNQQREAEQRAGQTSEPAAEAPPDHGDGPTSDEQQASADAYAASTRQVDERIHKELSKQGRAEQVRDLEMSFEKFVASLYMTTLMQLGLAAPQGEKPMLDLIGARQTIDILGILNDKTKGNLTPAEEGTLRNVLYELRMAYLEVTNLIANPPKDGVPSAS